MGDTQFPQTRTIDPFTGYYSDLTSRLLQGVTKGRDCLLTPHSFQVEAIPGDSTSVNIIDGFLVMDNILIQGTSSSFEVDFEDVDFYSAGSVWDSAGYYYICINYNYERSRPAAEASFRILKPSQRNLLDLSSDNFLLKVAQVVSVGAGYEISALYDYDPDAAFPDHRREFVHIYATLCETLPSFTQYENEGQIIYVVDEGETYFGGPDGWKIFSGIRDVVDTSLCTAGQLSYIAATGDATPAIATAYNTLADAVVLDVGASGKVALYGKVSDVLIEAGVNITLGDKVYLSETVAGTITDTPGTLAQYIGRCVESGIHAVSCNVWFMPDQLQQNATAAQHGLMTLTYAGKLDGIEALADVTDFANVQAALAAAAGAVDFNNQNLTGVGAITAGGILNMSTHKITNVVDPTVDQDAATKIYVDSLASGLDIKDPIRLATIAALPACTAAGEGVGKTLTADAVGVLTVDGVASALTDRILVKNQIDTTDNGIYEVTTAGAGGAAFVLTRATDADEDAEVLKGMYAFVSAGVTLIGTAWVLKADADPDLDPQEFAQFSFATSFVEDDPYGAGWNGDTTHAPSQNAVFDAIFPSGTRMLFGQNAAPTGWTKEAVWADNSMVVFTTGNIGSGGADSPISWTTAVTTQNESTHVHNMNSHTHTGPNHQHSITHTHSVTSNVAVGNHNVLVLNNINLGLSVDNKSGLSTNNESNHTHPPGTLHAGYATSAGTVYWHESPCANWSASFYRSGLPGPTVGGGTRNTGIGLVGSTNSGTAHGHTIPNHNHAMSGTTGLHKHTFSTPISNHSVTNNAVTSGPSLVANTGPAGTGVTGFPSTANTLAGSAHLHAVTQDTFTPKYQKVIAATKD